MNIKKILVPTDFSDTANNALRYAVDIAEQYGAEVDVVHAYTLPVLTARGIPILPDSDVAEANRQIAEEQLEETKKLVSGKYKVKLNFIATPIYWQMELAEVIYSQQIDLIVMGTTGAGGFKKFFIGSNTAGVIQRSPVPVLAVPEMAKLSQLVKIGFAYDGLQLKKIEKLSIINSFRDVLKASIHVFRIRGNKESSSPYLSKLIHFLSGASYDDVHESEIESGILKYVEINHLDMIVMIPRKRGFFNDLISGSITKNVSYQIPIPLLAIPE